MPKRPVAKDYNPVDDIESRVKQFIAVNEVALNNGELTDRERHMVEGQQIAFQAVITLTRMIRKRGSIWKGGYLDNVGVVYTDQVQDIIDGVPATIMNAELDEQLRRHLE